ncbi:MAG: AI-2E family transporter [Alphaproteobacteria bacterium]|nr:AI-2E family transporter [Alphaproteobacteria bacterium]
MGCDKMFSISEFIKINRVYFIWIVFFGLLYLFRDMFGLVFITFIMCFVVSSVAHKLRRKYRLNRRMVVVCFYILFLLGVIGFLKYIPPILLSETISFTEQLPRSIQSVKEWADSEFKDNEFIAPMLNQIEGAMLPEKSVVGAWNVLRGVLEAGIHYIGWFFLAMLFSFLILFDLPKLSKGVRQLRYTKLQETYHETADSIMLFARVVGENFRAQLIISLINTILTAVCLCILKVKAVALLSTIVFMCGLIPVLGMWISSAPIIVMAINSGGVELGLWALLMIIVIHLIEAYILNPRIVSSVMHINPVMTLIILYIAHGVIGMWGMLLGVPIAVYIYRKISISDK